MMRIGAAPERELAGATLGTRQIDENAASIAHEYHTRAVKHAPKTQDEFERAVRDFVARGYGEHDVARILGLGIQAVRQLSTTAAA